MPVKIGCDPEFLVVDNNGYTLSASSLAYNSSEHGEIGTDHGGSVGEFRPKPGSASEVTNHIKALFTHIKHVSPNTKIMAGGGVGTGHSIGGHIHIGGVPLRNHYSSFTRQRNRYSQRQLNLDMVNADHKLIFAFDFFIGRRLKKVPGGKRGSSCYGALSDIETKSHGGFEYRTPPSWLSDPQLTEATLAVSERIVELWQIKPSAFDTFIGAGKRAARKKDYNVLIPQTPASAQRYYQDQVANFKRVIFSKTYKMNSPDCLEVWTAPREAAQIVISRRGTERIQLQVCQIKLIKGSIDFNQETVVKVCRFGLPEVKIYALTQDHTPWHLRLTRDIRLRPNTIYFSKSLRQYLKIKRGKDVRTRFVELFQRNSGSTDPLTNVIFFNANSGNLVPQITTILETGARTKLRRE